MIDNISIWTRKVAKGKGNYILISTNCSNHLCVEQESQVGKPYCIALFKLIHRNIDPIYISEHFRHSGSQFKNTWIYSYIVTWSKSTLFLNSVQIMVNRLNYMLLRKHIHMLQMIGFKARQNLTQYLKWTVILNLKYWTEKGCTIFNRLESTPHWKINIALKLDQCYATL